jgi:hypothetical protein
VGAGAKLARAVQLRRDDRSSGRPAPYFFGVEVLARQRRATIPPS